MYTTKQNEYVALCSEGSKIRETNLYLQNRCFKGSDDIFNTKALIFTDVSSCLPWMINLLLQIVESRSTLRDKF